MNKWKDIWENREESTNENSVLQRLIALDGFDTGHGTMPEEAWLEYIERIRNKLNINNETSIFEVGCGAGAFLYPFASRGNKVGGLDYSQKLINIAKTYIHSDELTVSEANNINSKYKYDVVISNSVFFYFPSLDYASNVLSKMLEKANNKVAILEVNDASKKNLALKIRSQNTSKSYEGLDHLYYEKSWFTAFSKKNNLHIDIEDQNIPGYTNSSYRFNVFLSKP